MRAGSPWLRQGRQEPRLESLRVRTAEIELISSIDLPPTLFLLPTLNATATGPGRGEGGEAY